MAAQGASEAGVPTPIQNGAVGASAKPINDAVHHAFDDAHVSGIDHEALIARITQQVLKEIQSAPNVFGSQQFYAPPPPAAAPLSPTASSTTSPPPPPAAAPPPRNVYTPPSPHKTTDFTTDGIDSRRSSPDRVLSPPGSPNVSDPERPGKVAQPESEAQAKPAKRPPTSEETTLEKIWGKLFDAEGKGTEKLSQLLRGTATHMIECYEPKHSLVVTPGKMQRFYKDHPIPHEPYPWDAIFNDDRSYISRMYRQLGCEHHLVQEPGLIHTKPDIPGLTPRGFQQWATMLIQAHPDEALQRFQNVVLSLPISNPDDPKERFPKELPRSLFPKDGDRRTRDQLVQAIEEHAGVTIDHPSPSDTPRGQAPYPAAPPRNPSPPRSEASVTSDVPSMASSIERERKPYGGGSIPRDCAIDDTNPFPGAPPKPIERERKPYSAAPGGGRTFEDDGGLPTPQACGAPPPPSAPKSASQPPPPSIHRANSAASSRPINIPPPPSGRSRDYPPSAYSPNPNAPHRPSVSSAPRRRNYSPPLAAGFRASEGDVTNAFSVGSYERNHGPAFVDPYDDGRHYPRELRDSDSRRAEYAHGHSPGKRYDRTGTGFDNESRRPSSHVGIGEEFYTRPRRETTGSRPAW